ncbi:MAG: hypothetical protein WCG08_14410, partial [Paludibacter sp.]
SWEALVTENYEYIMPLPVKSRYKIPYLVQPVLTQQLGIFSKFEINEAIVEEFIKEIPYFSYELNLNAQNSYSKAIVYPNLLLNLNASYEDIYKLFSKNTQRNIDKAKKSELKILSGLSPEAYLSFYFSVDKHYLSPQQPVLKQLIEKGIAKNALTIYGVYSKENELIAALCLLKSSNRLIYLLPVSNTLGKKLFAMFLLINNIISENAEKSKVLDFEGSRIEGVARLYKSFGAKNHPYYILKRFRPSFLVGKI